MIKTLVRRELGNSISALGDLHPLLERIYQARQITSVHEISRELADLHSFHSLKNIDLAVQRLIVGLQHQESILIVGDFDTDGATSTALAVKALTLMGAKHVSYLVPSRFVYGYGLSPEIVAVAAEKKPQIIITVDNGISSIEGVKAANALGIDVIITDHHLAAEELPLAYAIVNPNQLDDEFPSKCIAGVGVIFYLMLALRASLKSINWFELQGIEIPNMVNFLDLVALGTVADVVSLDKNNRILVYQGLRLIRTGRARPGINALLKVAGRKCNELQAIDLGFSIGPRLNAAGRLDDMSVGVACLLAIDEKTALPIATELDELNKERRLIETKMREEAFNTVDHLHFSKQLPAGICLYQNHWHQGIVGLIAARVKEKFHRPVIAFAKESDCELKGSARSIAGLHIRDLLKSIAQKNPGLITRFGGHAMAAGLSLPIDKFEIFSQLFDQAVTATLSADELNPKIYSDGELNRDELTLMVAELLHNAGPWGQGFPEPLFDGIFVVVNQRIVGKNHLKLTLQVPETDVYLEAMLFHADLEKWPNNRCNKARVVYRLDINEFNGRRKLQLIVEQMEVV